MRPLILRSTPCRRVRPKFVKYPKPVCCDATNKRSLLFSPRNQPTFQRKLFSWALRRPASKVLVTTCFRGGSLTSALGKLHGSSGLAQPSSIAVGARLDSL